MGWHMHPVAFDTPTEPFVVVDRAKSVHLVHCAEAVLPAFLLYVSAGQGRQVGCPLTF